jgi:hypothetical protein
VELFLGVNDGNFPDNTLGWTATISNSNSCTLSAPLEPIASSGEDQYDGLPTTMAITFEPGQTMSTLANACGYLGFDWQSTIDVWPLPDPKSRVISSRLLLTVSQHKVPLSLRLSGRLRSSIRFRGYNYQPPGSSHAYPFFYEPLGYISRQQAQPIVIFTDTPTFHALPSGQYMEFTTALVGVDQTLQPIPLSLDPVTWVSDF